MSGTVVPTPTNGDVPITGLEELLVHLDDLISNPETPIALKLFDHVELQLTESNIPPLLPVFLPKLTTILKTTQQDPAIPVNLTIKLLAPVSFQQSLTLADQDSLITALASPAPSANILGMTIIHKAAASPNDLAYLATMPVLLARFLHAWLATPQVEVGEKGSRVLGDLLEADATSEPLHIPRPAVTIDGVSWTNGSSGGSIEARHLKPRGTGALWSQLAQDESLNTLLYTLPQGKDPLSGENISEHQTSLAQGRILRILPRLASLEFNAVATPIRSGGSSLLRFTAVEMVDKSDVLMHLSLVDFCETLLSLLRIRVDMNGPEREGILRTLREVLADATKDDDALRTAIATLPDRTVPEEADGLRAFIQRVLP